MELPLTDHTLLYHTLLVHYGGRTSLPKANRIDLLLFVSSLYSTGNIATLSGTTLPNVARVNLYIVEHN